MKQNCLLELLLCNLCSLGKVDNPTRFWIHVYRKNKFYLVPTIDVWFRNLFQYLQISLRWQIMDTFIIYIILAFSIIFIAIFPGKDSNQCL